MDNAPVETPNAGLMPPGRVLFAATPQLGVLAVRYAGFGTAPGTFAPPRHQFHAMGRAGHCSFDLEWLFATEEEADVCYQLMRSDLLERGVPVPQPIFPYAAPVRSAATAAAVQKLKAVKYR